LYAGLHNGSAYCSHGYYTPIDVKTVAFRRQKAK
jgi:hypothetical protein